MNIEQYTSQIIAHIIANSTKNGETKEQAVIIPSVAKHMLFQAQNEIISSLLEEGYWKKVEQSLLIENGVKFDKIIIENFLDNGLIIEKVFWFNITHCLG